MARIKDEKERAGSVVAESSAAAAARNDDSLIKHEDDVTPRGRRSTFSRSKTVASSPIKKEDASEETKAAIKLEDGAAEISPRQVKRFSTPVKQEGSSDDPQTPPDLAKIKADLAPDEAAQKATKEGTALAPWEPGVHPFSLSGPDFLALCLVTPDEHILWLEKYLHHWALTKESRSHHMKPISLEEVRRDLDMHLKTLAKTHGVSHSLLQAVYMHKRERQLLKPIETRFAVEDNEQDIDSQQIEEVLGRTRKNEIKKEIQGKIEAQLKPLNLMVHYLRMRLNGLSQPYDTVGMQLQAQAITGKPLSIAMLTAMVKPGMRLVADLDGWNAEETYWRSTDGTTPTPDNILSSRNTLVAGLLYTNKELQDIHNLCRVKPLRKSRNASYARKALERSCFIFAHACEIGGVALRCACDRQRTENATFMGWKSTRSSNFDSVLNHAKAYAIVNELQVQALRPSNSTQYLDNVVARRLPSQGYEMAQIIRKGIDLSCVVNRGIAEHGQRKTDEPPGDRTRTSKAKPNKGMGRPKKGGKRKRQACPCCSHYCDDPKSLRDHLRSSADCYRYCGPDHDPDPPKKMLSTSAVQDRARMLAENQILTKMKKRLSARDRPLASKPRSKPRSNPSSKTSPVTVTDRTSAVQQLCLSKDTSTTTAIKRMSAGQGGPLPTTSSRKKLKIGSQIEWQRLGGKTGLP